MLSKSKSKKNMSKKVFIFKKDKRDHFIDEKGHDTGFVSIWGLIHKWAPSQGYEVIDFTTKGRYSEILQLNIK